MFVVYPRSERQDDGENTDVANRQLYLCQMHSHWGRFDCCNILHHHFYFWRSVVFVGYRVAMSCPAFVKYLKIMSENILH